MPKFIKGQSGNPAGRPVGSKNHVTKLREAIAEELPAIINALVSEASSGNVAAASLLLSRCLPPLRPVTETGDIPLSGATLGERAERVALSALTGDLSPTVASELMAMLGQQGRIMETEELMRRIDRLERVLDAQK